LHPAPSIILFTTLSGAGYGLLFLLGLGAPLGLIPSGRWLGLSGLALALGLITLGLLASTRHLAHPERAWRAVSQVRTSWLSREGALAMITYLPTLILGLGWVVFERTGGWFALCGLLAALSAALTVYCTGMIYASLKPVREWHQPLVAPIYLAFALLSGALLAHLLLTLFGAPRALVAGVAIIGALLAFGLKTLYWRTIADLGPGSTAESATGLGALGKVRMIEPPHTQTNYLLTEMGFTVARKHARKLRLLGYALGSGGAALLTLLALASTGAVAGMVALLAALSGITGIVIERWLFFAEATHTVMLYYGRERARPGAAAD
jgi:sulfite dehydrogenase (quinone) subunit SoeC